MLPSGRLGGRSCGRGSEDKSGSFIFERASWYETLFMQREPVLAVVVSKLYTFCMEMPAC
jgi:hypothetical protein